MTHTTVACDAVQKKHAITKNRMLVGPIEAIDGTPVVDIKPVVVGLRDEF